MRNPIVVAVDGSEASLRAAEWAAREAVRRTALLRIVAAPGPLPRTLADPASSVKVANALRGLAAHALAAAVDRVIDAAPGVVIDTHLLDGPPAAAVSQSGAGAQLLVVGAHGAGGTAAVVLGSVSRQVAASAPCPLVVVCEDTVSAHREIVVVVRDPDEAGDALGLTSKEAAPSATNLTVVPAGSARGLRAVSPG